MQEFTRVMRMCAILSAAAVGGHDGGDRNESRIRGDRGSRGGRFEGRGRAISQDGDGNHRQDHVESRRLGRRLATRGTADRRHLVRVPGADDRGW